MLSSLRKLPFVLAIVLIVLAVVIEFLVGCFVGVGLSALALFDTMVLLTVGLISAPMILGNATVGRTQGVVTLVAAVGILLLVFAAILFAMFLVFKMLAYAAMILPYLAQFANFETGVSNAALSVVLLLKMGFALAMIAAQQKFLDNTGLVIIVGISIGLTMLLLLLHGFPTIIVSITDCIGAIIILILAVFRGLGFALGALPAIKKAAGI